MSNVPDAWDDDYSLAADKRETPNTDEGSNKAPPSKKQTKAQKRAQQAEFNRQLWAEAEGPRQTNYFLESRKEVPLRSEFKPPPVLLSRRGPPVVQQQHQQHHHQQQQPQQRLRNQTLGDGLQNLSLSSRNNNSNNSNNNEESEEDEDELERQRLEREQRKEQAKRDREEKQRKYEERRQELFGTPSSVMNGGHVSRSGGSSPGSATPPGSRSQTPNRGRGRGARGVGRGNGGPGRGGGQLYYQQQLQQHQQHHAQQYVNYYRQQQQQQQPQHQQHAQPQHQQELFEPMYAPRPELATFERKERDLRERKEESIERPIRQSRGPDGSGRAGFGFVARGGKAAS